MTEGVSSADSAEEPTGGFFFSVAATPLPSSASPPTPSPLRGGWAFEQGRKSEVMSTGISANRLEILQIADAVAREKSIEKDIVIQAMEHALHGRVLPA